MSRRLLDVLPEIGERVVRAPHWLLGLDFDGTLTPLVDHPDLVRLSGQVQQQVRSLAGHPRIAVAIISGRERSDLQARVGIPGLIYAGNHGLEISGPGFCFVEPTAVECVDALGQLAADLTTRLQPIAWAFVENKGLTLSVHYRQTAPGEYDEVRQLVHAALARTNHPFLLTPGDQVYEIRPRVQWNKGAAMVWIEEQLGISDTLAIYLGDDATDEDAFEALGDGITVKVGDPTETAAHYHVESPAEVEAFLKWLAHQLPSMN